MKVEVMKIFIIFLLWFLEGNFVSANANDTNFFIDFLKIKWIGAATAYLCTTPGEKFQMLKTFNKNFVQLSIVDLPNDNYVKVDFQFRHEGVIVDTSCDGVPDLIAEGSNRLWFKSINCWVFFQELSCPESYNDTREISQLGFDLLSVGDLYVHSQVYWVQNTCGGQYVFLDAYRISKHFKVNATVFGVYPKKSLKHIVQKLPPFGRRRKNYHRAPMVGAAAILSPKEYTYMSDYRTRNFDPWTKWNYPVSKMMVQDLNIDINVTLFTNFGTDQNGTGIYDGLLGCFQRRECDVGFGAMLMTEENLKMIEVITQPLQVKVRFVFRNPPLSKLTNIFILPFDFYVWICSIAIFVLIGIVFALQLWIDKKNKTNEDVTLTEAFTFVIGAICQQGTWLQPKTLSTRTSLFLIFVASYFLYTSYSANIVSLLQTPSKSIRTVKNLIESPLELAAQNVTYSHEYLEHSKYPLIQRLYQEKLMGQPDNGFMHPSEGMRRVRDGLFAFQVELAYAYNYMSYNYTETEKCSITEIEAIRLPVTCVPAQVNSPNRDIFSQRLKWQREVGLFNRIQKIWSPQKPKCDNFRGGYVSVGLSEMKPAIHVIVYGTMCAVFILLVELLVHWRNNHFAMPRLRKLMRKKAKKKIAFMN